jgi:3-dehydroquinate synthase
MRAVTVDLGHRSYQVFVGAGVLRQAAALLGGPGGWERVVLVTDAHVDPAWGNLAVESLGRLGSSGQVERIVVAAGETSKSLQVAGDLLEDLARRSIRRGDLLVALGGGMVGDLGGFVASVYQRGMTLLQAPTSLLAQVDAAVGGKTAVNLTAGKNLVGSFYQPRAVLADTATLTTLPDREYLSGLAEVAKYGFVFDAGLLELLEDSAAALRRRDAGLLEAVVARSVEIKASVVSSDELDLADRRIMLNYGHTFAHALERAGGYERWLHGEAVSLGMVFAARLAEAAGLLDAASAERHRRVLAALGLPVTAAFDPAEIELSWSMDKKYRGGVRWVLLNGIGCPAVTTKVGSREISTAMAAVQAR